jgi:hypothetical protein
MNIAEEKVYIYSMMRDITEERRDLTKIYFELKSRLDELNRLELRGLEDLSVKGYVDLNKSRNTETAIINIQREASHAINKVQQEANPEPEEKTVIPKLEIEREKDEIAKKSRKSTGLPLEKVAGFIAHVLKEHGVPMSVKDLYEEVNERAENQITRNNFRNNMLPRAAKLNSKINNVSRGFYQYLS